MNVDVITSGVRNWGKYDEFYEVPEIYLLHW